MGLATVGERSRALLLAGHPLPTVAVTGLMGVLAGGAGLRGGRLLLLVAAVLSGQLSIGWCNDAVDAVRDAAVGRPDKPTALGRVSRRTVWRAATLAAAACVPLSLALGGAAGTVHLLAVGGGWAYNLGLKSTWWSWLPYAASFGALPGVVTLALPHPAAPAWWAVGAGVLIGIGAHLTNALPDLDDDAATGVRGAPHRLGRRVSGVLAPVVLLLAVALVVLPAGAPGPAMWAALGGAGVVAGSGATVSAARPGSRFPFVATIGVAAVAVAVLAARGDVLT